MTPLDLWKLYPIEARAVVDHFFDCGDGDGYRTDVSWPVIECVVFTGIDRGVANWKKFGEMLRIWFPSLRTLMINQKSLATRAITVCG